MHPKPKTSSAASADLAVTLALAYVRPSDLRSASRVCRHWRDAAAEVAAEVATVTIQRFWREQKAVNDALRREFESPTRAEELSPYRSLVFRVCERIMMCGPLTREMRTMFFRNSSRTRAVRPLVRVLACLKGSSVARRDSVSFPLDRESDDPIDRTMVEMLLVAGYDNVGAFVRNGVLLPNLTLAAEFDIQVFRDLLEEDRRNVAAAHCAFRRLMPPSAYVSRDSFLETEVDHWIPGTTVRDLFCKELNSIDRDNRFNRGDRDYRDTENEYGSEVVLNTFVLTRAWLERSPVAASAREISE